MIRTRRFLFTYMHGNFSGESGWGKVVEIMLLNKDWDQNLPATRLLSLLSSSELCQVARGCKVSNWTATLMGAHALGSFLDLSRKARSDRSWFMGPAILS